MEDKIYGRFAVTEPVLADLLKAPTVLRLKGVSQRGYPDFIKEKNSVNYTRYEHSVGCMLLLKKLDASLEEQIAGLLHDVSHTAFSHVIDWVVGDPIDQNHQDSVLKEYIMNSELPEILKKHGLDPKKLSELEEMDHYGLMERKVPQLCVDRLDYSLRDMRYSLGHDVSLFIENVTTHRNHVVFKDFKAADEYAKVYYRCQKEIYAAPNNVVRYYLISKCLKMALEEGVIKEKDLYKNEDEIIELISRKGSGELSQRTMKAFGALKYEFVKTDGLKLKTKYRYVDPEFLEDGSVRRVSEIDDNYKQFIEAEKKEWSEGFMVRFLDD